MVRENKVGNFEGNIVKYMVSDKEWLVNCDIVENQENFI